MFSKFRILILIFAAIFNENCAQQFLKEHEDNFKSPPMDCWPHTRWWWPGNAQSKDNITYELEQMRSVGIRGVEQITMSPVYTKGNIEYLSDEYLELVKHTVVEAKRLEMEVSFNFGGPGWIIGGDWVEDKDKSRDMIPTYVDVEGPGKYQDTLPKNLIQTDRSWEEHRSKILGYEKLLAVVAGKINEGSIDSSTLIVLTDRVSENVLKWDVPDGKWRISSYWLSIDTSHNAVNHFDQSAMENYCNYIGGKFLNVVGEEFGKTVESFFCDSFELAYQPSGIKWSDGLLGQFEVEMGYDLTKYLPAIWWEVNNLSPKIRYDVNRFLAELGLKTFYEPFLSWCEENGVKGRIQTYGFETDNIKSAGVTHIPEMEITPGEKDQHPWYDTRIGPKKYVASGAHIYGKNTVSVEAHTFLHWERYRATMEEVKISTDGFLRSGANKFYNHGYSSSLERDLAPSRRMPWAPQINPTNVWWKYYPLLTEYTARCSYLLRQGEFAPDIAIYSPLANQWAKDALNARRWTRDFNWGELGDLLISNGYDFDLLNDDAIQNIAEFEKGEIQIRQMRYKLLLVPNIESIPLPTLNRIQEYILRGGTVVALDRLPQYSTGLSNFRINDMKVQKIVDEIFGGLNGVNIEAKKVGEGTAHYFKKVIHREIWWDQFSSMLDPFLKILKKYIQPDFGINFGYEEIRKNNGLTFLHRKLNDADLYFVANIQDKHVSMPVYFRIQNKNVWNWNPYNGDITQLFHYSREENSMKVPIDLAPWESTIIVFEEGKSIPYVSTTSVDKVSKISNNTIYTEVRENGSYYVKIINDKKEKFYSKQILDVPSSIIIDGRWNLILESDHFTKVEKKIDFLKSWSDDEETKFFSGTGKYNIDFYLPKEYVSDDVKLELDLGKLGNIAEVHLNGKSAGTVWMKGQNLDITNLVKIGNNHLIVLVTNTNINRVSSFKEIVPVPKNLVDKYGEAMSATRIPREFGFKPLPPSGLIGPVKINPIKLLEFEYSESE